MSFLLRIVEDVMIISTVTHFGENNRLHLESSKQSYNIISVYMSNNKSNLNFCLECFAAIQLARQLQQECTFKRQP